MSISKDVGSQRLNLAHIRSLSLTLLPRLSLPPSISISLIPKMKRFTTLSSLAQCVSDGFILVGFPLLLDLCDKAVEREDERERENTERVNKCSSLAAVWHWGGLSPSFNTEHMDWPFNRDSKRCYGCLCACWTKSVCLLTFIIQLDTVGNLSAFKKPKIMNLISNWSLVKSVRRNMAIIPKPVNEVMSYI